jgi:hypothetical protein
MREKFSNVDRRRVIRELELRRGIHLSAIERKSVWQSDQTGREYLILGGRGDWHGIPREVVRAERGPDQEARLIFCDLAEDAIRVFEGDLRHLLRNADRLHVSQEKLTFNLSRATGRLGIAELSGFYLTRIFDIPYTEPQREQQRAVDTIMSDISKMSDDEKQRLLKELEQLQSENHETDG